MSKLNLLILALFLYSCTDYVAQMEDEFEKTSLSQNSKDCVPRSLKKSLAKENGYIDAMTLDVVIRDFPSNHPDFENFAEEAAVHLDDIYNYKTSSGTAMNLNGYDLSWFNNASYHNTCGIESTFNKFGIGAQIGADGIPKQKNPYLPVYLQYTSLTDEVLKYGECAAKYSGLIVRGYKNSYDGVSGYRCPNGNTVWANSVVYTPGMVNPYLVFTQFDANGAPDMYEGVLISKQNERCDNQHFEQWYADVPGVNKRINTTLSIPKDPNGSNSFIFDYNYNNGGFFPLDSIDLVTKKWIGLKYPGQYGPQTLSIYCPPYNYKYANSQLDSWGQNTFALCQSWLNYGGPRAVNSAGSEKSAAIWAASENGTLGLQHLRNYGFTMMGYAKFKYRASNQVLTPEVFEVAGDDDMWIFVDGVLVVDLGGTHEPAPGKVDISVLAKYNHGCHVGEPLATFSNCSGASDATGWADDSWHHLHIFYADRQSDGSNIYIRSSLAEIAPSRYGQPVIKDFIADGDVSFVYLNTPLDNASLASIRSSAAPSLLVMRDVNVNGKMQTVVNGFYVKAIEGPVDKGTDGMKYVFEGVLLDAAGNAIDGGLLADDRIAFNVPYSESLEYDGNRGNFSNDVWNQIMYWSKLMNFYVTSPSGLQVERFDGKEWWAKVRYASVSGNGSEIEYCED